MSSSVEAVARGHFVTLEGGEGTGKSTQARLLVQRLAEVGLEAVATREPGGTPLAEGYRAALLSGALASLGPAAEALVFSAARIDHLDRKIIPTLARGCTVVCDRFVDSTLAYQGALGHLDPNFLAGLQRAVVGAAMPDLTFVLDLPVEIGLARAAKRRGGEGTADRFEKEERGFHEDLRQVFLDIAARDRHRCRVIDASQSADAVAQAIWVGIVDHFGPGLHHGSARDCTSMSAEF